jgi:hypothetical protein
MRGFFPAAAAVTAATATPAGIIALETAMYFPYYNH